MLTCPEPHPSSGPRISLPPRGWGGASLLEGCGRDKTPFKGDSRLHTDAFCGVLWVLQRHSGPQETPTWGPYCSYSSALHLCPAGASGQGAPCASSLSPGRLLSPGPPCPSSASDLGASIQNSLTPETQMVTLISTLNNPLHHLPSQGHPP